MVLWGTESGCSEKLRLSRLDGSYQLCTEDADCSDIYQACRCNINYYGTPTSSCVRATCNTTVINGATFEGVPAGETSSVPCPTGLRGNLTRTCVQDQEITCFQARCATGTFPDSALQNFCVPITCQPPANVEFDARYTATAAFGDFMTGVCDETAGYRGTIFRRCVQSGIGNNAIGVLEAPINNCSLITCPTLNSVEYGAWPATITLGSDQNVTTTCANGYRSSGTPQRICRADGTWDENISNPCVQTVCEALPANPTSGAAGYASVAWSFTPVQGTCPIGYRESANGAPTRVCQASGNWSTEVNPCVRVQCPALPGVTSTGSGSFAAVNAPSDNVVGTCPPGWAGAPRRDCTLSGSDGEWLAESSLCVRLACPSVDDEGNADWPEALAGENNVVGRCREGFEQPQLPRRNCGLDGNWQGIVGECTRAVCRANEFDNANWLGVFANETQVGSCLVGFRNNDEGAPLRVCFLNATWSSTVERRCIRRSCPVRREGNADWPETSASTATQVVTAFGTCIDDFQGSPTRVCGSNGEWQEVSGACGPNQCGGAPDCVLNCPSRTEANADWPETVGNTEATGTCIAGWAGALVRGCGQYGTWQPVIGSCAQLSCPAGVRDDATWAAALSGSTGNLGTCQPGYRTESGLNPARACSTRCLDGECDWEPVASSEACLRLRCPALAGSLLADWPESLSGTAVVQGLCVPGFSGIPTRPCLLDGRWGELISSCQQIRCPSTASNETLDDPTALWDITAAGTTDVIGTCKLRHAPSVVNGAEVFPQRSCDLSGAWGPVSNPCQRLRCPSVQEAFASFPEALAGDAQVLGTCDAAYTGSPKRACSDQGVWGTIVGACARRRCGADQDFNATWPSNTASESTVSGTCLPGFAGTVTRLCRTDGTWDLTVQGQCIQLICDAVTETSVVWPRTPAGVTVQGTCQPTYAGSAQRPCSLNATWSAPTGACEPIFCPEGIVNGTSFARTRAGSSAIGVCVSEFEVGSPTRSCSATGVWNAIQNPCVRIAMTCAADASFKNAVWRETPAGQDADGACLPGFAPVDATQPARRACIRVTGDLADFGVWDNNTVVNPCSFRPGLDSPDVRIADLSVSRATSSSITLSWRGLNTTLFDVYLSANGVDFFREPFTVTNGTTWRKSDLAESTTYQFRVLPGDDRLMDSLGAGVEATTLINPPANVTLADVGASFITVRWAKGSSLTAAFLLFVRREGNAASPEGRFARNNEFTLVLNYTQATEYRATNLLPATTYLFWIRAARSDGSVETEGTFFQARTDPDTASFTEFASRNAGLVGGILGAVLGVIAILVIGFVVYRRQINKRHKRLLDDYSSQLQMLTMNRSGVLPGMFGDSMTLTPEMLKANLMVPKTQFRGADATLLNTVMEVALPGFLQMNYSSDLRPDARLTAGGAGTLFRGSLLNADAIQRNGTEACAIKEITPWPTLSDEDNQSRFHHEISVMWSLSFHRNIVKLIGYTEEPSTIVMKLYVTDLFRYLHSQDSKDPLEQYLMLHLCSGMISAVAAIHSMGIAHRDIKSPNFLMQEPQPGSPFPDPILCDFGLARSSDESDSFASIRGISPRYASPEVFARFHLKNSSNTVEDDKQADVYSLGVVLWETVCRQIPWDGISNEDIEIYVRSGNRVPDLEVDPDDRILVLLKTLLDNALKAQAETRPTAAAMNNKMAGFIRELLGENL